MKGIILKSTTETMFGTLQRFNKRAKALLPILDVLHPIFRFDFFKKLWYNITRK